MLIGITGKIAAGKDTAADYLCNTHGFKRMSFAGSLKDSVASVFNWDRELLEGATKESREWRESIDQWWATRLNIPHLTPRWVLQYWGTEVCRRGFHNDIWVASIERKLFDTKEDIVITDCRFPNELAAIKNAGGITIRIERGPKHIWEDFATVFNNTDNVELRVDILSVLENEHHIHASEYSSVGLSYDHIIDNNSDIGNLHLQLASIIDF